MTRRTSHGALSLALTLALCAGLSGRASAAEKVGARGRDVSVAFGNTVVSVYSDGRKAKLWLAADGSYTAKGRRNLPSSGVWSLKGEKICLKQRKPQAVPFSYCTTAPEGGVGVSWKAKAVTGEPITVSVVKGLVDG
jgi:hypothetical protein